ncbi:MAG: hypothetical protein QXS41_00960 [Candidatus Woesearchaeota archaeon]
MMFLNIYEFFREIFEIAVVSFAVAFIFKNYFEKPKMLDLLDERKRILSDGFYKALIYVAPAIIVHELAHKFVAISFGYEATFHAAYFWLFVGVVLKLLNFPFIFLVPAYVSIPGNATNLAAFFIAIAGPLSNLLMFLSTYYLVKKTKNPEWYAFGIINFWLFIFNMIPLPGFDGFKALISLWKLIF